jgi:hypothetical protein
VSNAALTYAPHAFNVSPRSAAAQRIMRRSTRDVCKTGKKAYRTPRKARIALETLQRDEQRRQTALGQDARVERNFYPCPHCGLLHLTSRA